MNPQGTLLHCCFLTAFLERDHSTELSLVVKSVYSSAAELLALHRKFWFCSMADFVSKLKRAAHPAKILCFLFPCSHNNFVAILDLPEGEHQYKFFVDGQWTHDPSEVLYLLPLVL